MAQMALIVAGNAFSAGLGSKSGFSWSTFAIMTAGQLLSNRLGKGQEGPRLADLSVQVSSEGEIIPRVYGKIRSAGNIIWSSGKKEHRRTVDSGGGSLGPPENTEFTYTSSFQVLLSDKVTTRPLKIWANEHLIYDASEAGSGDSQNTVSWTGGSTSTGSFTTSEIVVTQDPTTGTWEGTAGSTTIRYYTGDPDQLPDPDIEADKGVGNVPAGRGQTSLVLVNLDLTPYGNSVPTITCLMEEATTTAAGILEDISELVGLDPDDDIDFSAMGSEPITGYVIADSGTARRVFEDIGQKTFFDFPTIDGKLTAVARTAASTITLDNDDLRIKKVGSSNVTTRWGYSNELVKPRMLEMRFLDVGRNYEPGMRRFIKQHTDSDRIDSMEMKMAMTGGQAQKVASIEGAVRWNEVDDIAITMGWKYLYLAPSDRIVVDGKTYRIIEKSPEMLGPITATAVRHVPAIYNQVAGAETAGLPSPTVQTTIGLSVVIVDSNAMRDADLNEPGIYIVVSGPDDVMFPSVRISANASVGVGTTSPAIDHAPRGCIGTTVGTLADSLVGPDRWDRDNTLTVDLIGGALTSEIESVVLHGANAALVGYEIIQFSSASYLGVFSGKKRYQLGTMLRGRRGTEQFMATHGSGEAFVLLNRDVSRWALTNSSIGHTLSVNVAQKTPGMEGISSNYTIPIIGRNMMPFAPAYCEATQDGSDNWNFRWQRRTRAIQAAQIFWENKSERPLQEQTEKYAVDILNGSGDIIRTIETTSESAQYTAAQQVTDFTSVQSTITADISQISAIVGKGYKTRVVGPL